ncbi:MAG: FtsQ-type POTRA domain-containing protein [Puniceicoccales bacterium]|jgi:cell division septal protein FtsQ|nr:FtsQ-type POTRA domain-containing protein [Puniceicoccales bacterium]
MNFGKKLKKILLALLLFLLFPLLGAVLFFGKNLTANAFHQNALKNVKFTTNGKITSKWLMETLAMEKNVNLFSLDIAALERNLKSVSQIKKVFLEKRYPDSLFIQIEERIPILKIMVKVNEEKKVFLVDGTDGKVFAPICYAAEDLENILPADMVLRLADRKKLQFFSQQKMAAIKELIETLKNDFREIFNSIKFVDLKNYDERPGAVWSRIELHLKNGIVVVLGLEKFTFQLLRLEYLLDVKCVNNLHRIKKIDVSSLNDAVIEYM